MKALIIKPEWLNKIFDEGKTWEMRTTRTKIRGRIALIESGSGLVVGEANLVDSLDAIEADDTHYDKHLVEDATLLEKWKFPWVLAGAEKYEKPIPYTHPKGAVVWVKLKEELIWLQTARDSEAA